MPGRRLHLILHAKAADRPDIQAAIEAIRSDGHELHVAVTRKARAARRMAHKLAAADVVVVAAGGDGTVNETAAGLLDAGGRAMLGVLPAGTANDFARGCGYPEDPLEALRLAADGEARLIDTIRVGEHWIVNVASAAFTGAEVVAVPQDAKRLLGGLAYWVQGFLRTLKLEPRRLRWRWPGGADEADVLLLTVANGRQTGGGAKVAASALLDDGLLDVRVVRDFPLLDLPTMLGELADPADDPDGYIARYQVPWFEVDSDAPWHMTADGESLDTRAARFEVVTRRLPVILPPGAPLVGTSTAS
jgi:lipid kinase YegS